ncbi:hypothetical protein K443DRAFT_419501 [Laccaria amethystina LaAM-08-1]|uniref:Uncharacterized protein n=1 Tax=Laccaria amethystina LaAM-08-1 TaxID=1095629 RepID=A0A0C9WVU2_9AGAR|nr:hypothetical protein K443DRAFT_419501 [Laccaria amethystina LaAM-08-1]
MSTTSTAKFFKSLRNNCLAYKSQVPAPPSADPTDVVASLVPSSIVPAASDGPEGSQRQTRWFVDPARCLGVNPLGASCNIFDDVCCQGFCLPVALFVVSQRKTSCLPAREFAPFIFAHLVPIIHCPLPPFSW